MKSYLRFIVLALTIVSGLERIQAQTQSDALADSVNNLLTRLQKSAGLTADGIRLSESRIAEFSSLFQDSSALLFDDLSLGQDSLKARYLSLAAYLETARSAYPTGFDIRLGFSPQTISKEKSVKGTSYSKVYIPIQKEMIGMYQNRRLIKRSSPIVAEIWFSSIDGQPSELRIAALHHQTTYDEILVAQSSKGIHVGYKANVGFAAIGSIGVALGMGNEVADIYNNWTMSAKMRTSHWLMLHYYVTPRFAWSIGLGLGNYQTQFKSASNTTPSFQDAESKLQPRTDIDGDSYYLLHDIDITELVSLSTLDIPIGFTLSSAKRRGLNVFMRPLIVVGLPQKGNSLVSGQAIRRGYYPQYPVELYDLEEYGFGTRRYNSESFEWKAATSISASLELGFFVPLSDKLRLHAGAMALYGFTQVVGEDSRFPDDVLETMRNLRNANEGSSTLNSLSVSIGLSYKL